METMPSEGVAWTGDYVLWLPSPSSRLRIHPPAPTRRLVLAAALDASEGTIEVDPGAASPPISLAVAAESGAPIYHDIPLVEPTRAIDVRLSAGGTVNFVGYEA